MSYLFAGFLKVVLMFSDFDIIRVLDTLPGIILGLTFHEFAHAWTALRLGDDTAKSEGRVSLDPFKHVDWLGFLFIVLAGFGWAKPVSFNPERLSRPNRDSVMIALAGPIMNALLAVILAMVYVLGYRLHAYDASFGSSIGLMLKYGIFINWGLFVFNLIPIPPLDGSHVFFHRLRNKPELYAKIYRYGAIVLFVILIIEKQLNTEILPIGSLVRTLGQSTIRLLGG